MPGLKRFTIPVLLCMALFLITFCSQSSPLYPLNTWDDANCLLTVGRAMRSGTVLYKEIYEQKGPTLYAMHALAALISDRSFLGVYLLEIAACFLTLLAAYRICLSLGHMRSLTLVAFFGAVTYASFSFSRGDSAEEFCLPCLMGMLMIADDMPSGDGASFSGKRLFLLGLLSGIVGTIKFTILGVPLGICLYIGVCLLPHHLKELLRLAGIFLSGMLIPIVIWIIYFSAKGALRDFFTAYIYNNIFLYAGGSGTYPGRLTMLLGNGAWIALLILACIGFIRARRGALFFPLLIQSIVLFLGGRMWFYTLLALTPFSIFGLRNLSRLVQKKWIYPIVGTVVLAAAAILTPNAGMRFVPVEHTAQGMLSGRIEPGASFLQYSHLDDGLYLLTGSLPEERFFCSLNVQYPEMRDELDRYLYEGIPRYVLITWRMLPEGFTKYHQIDYANEYDVFNQTTKDFFLYERIE